MQSVNIWVGAVLCAVFMVQAIDSVSSPLTSEQATELLVRSVAANQKCKILSGTEAIELANFNERAKQLLILTSNHKTAQSIITRGVNTGNAVRCDDTTANAVRGVLRAAKAANEDIKTQLRGSVTETDPPKAELASIPVAEEPEPAADPVEIKAEPAAIVVAPDAAPVAIPPVVNNLPVRKKIFVVKPDKSLTKTKLPTPKPARTAASPILASYGRMAEVYYLQRRCRNLTSGSMAGLYQKILVMHRFALRSNPVASVARALRAAESKAGRQGC
jgi:hypothetical protein